MVCAWPHAVRVSLASGVDDARCLDCEPRYLNNNQLTALQETFRRGMSSLDASLDGNTSVSRAPEAPVCSAYLAQAVGVSPAAASMMPDVWIAPRRVLTAANSLAIVHACVALEFVGGNFTYGRAFGRRRTCPRLLANNVLEGHGIPTSRPMSIACPESGVTQT